MNIECLKIINNNKEALNEIFHALADSTRREMPQFSETVDTITVELKEVHQGCEMKFIQNIIVPHEVNWTKSDIEKALGEYRARSEHGWNLMFMGLKELLETGEISYKG